MAANTSSRWNTFWQPVPSSTPEEMDQSPLPDTPAKSKTWQATVSPVPSWPMEARHLKKHTWISSLFAIGDVILVLLPIYFILLGIAVVTLNNKAVEGNAFATKVTAAIQLGPTLFPIMFAAISGRSMKMIARFLAERGTKLGTLELLMASQSVWGTIESQVLTRRMTLVGVNLLFLWTMSPLGGQASLRLLEKSTSTAQIYTPLRYLSTGPGSAAWAMTSGTYVENDGSLSQVEPLYAAALLSSNQIKTGPEDTWGNVKIPHLEDLNSSWTDIQTNFSRPEDYYSLVGIPVIGRPQDRDGNFSLETSQLTIECEPFDKAMVGKYNFTQMQKLVPGYIWKNMSEKESPWGQETAGGRVATFFLQTDLPLTQGSDGRFDSYSGFVNTSTAKQVLPKRRITYASAVGYDSRGDTILNMANCYLGQVHTETMIDCKMDRCSAVRQRRSLSDTRDENTTPFDHVLISELALKAFPMTFGWARGSNPTEQFLFNSSSFQFVSPTTMLGTNKGWVDMALLSPEIFSRRLALLLNTYYQLTIAPNAYLGNLPQNNFTAFGLDTIPSGDVDAYLSGNTSTKNTPFLEWYNEFQDRSYYMGIYFIGATTNATISKTHDVFKCNFAWFSLLLAAAVTILLTGAASLILKWKTLGPEMFGFVTSMTYENRFFNIPRGGTMLDGMERARLLKDVPVCVGDVRGSDDVGHIAFASGVPLRKLERGRLYC